MISCSRIVETDIDLGLSGCLKTSSELEVYLDKRRKILERTHRQCHWGSSSSIEHKRQAELLL